MRHTYANTRGKERERVIERGWNRQSALHKKQQEKTTTQKATGEDQYHHSQNRTYLPMCNFSRRRQTPSTKSVSTYTRQEMRTVSMDVSNRALQMHTGVYAMVSNRALGMYI